jgi:hypothetical protein
MTDYIRAKAKDTQIVRSIVATSVVDPETDEIVDDTPGSWAEPEFPQAGDRSPGGNGSLEQWQEYARSLGATDADLEGKTRNDLRDAYTQKES